MNNMYSMLCAKLKNEAIKRARNYQKWRGIDMLDSVSQESLTAKVASGKRKWRSLAGSYLGERPSRERIRKRSVCSRVNQGSGERRQ